MKQIAAGRTVFIIAHRLSTVRTADRIITLEAGRVVEDGNHNDLLHSNGRYAKLHLLQAGLHGLLLSISRTHSFGLNHRIGQRRVA